MLFSSLQFICMFFPAFFICYYVALFIEKLTALKRGHSHDGQTTIGRNTVLLLFSIFFYAMGQPENIILIFISLIINYISALLIDKFHTRNKCHAGLILTIDIAANLGLLGYYKYSGFALSIIKHLTGAAVEIPDIVLPIGISFFTFQIISYVIDVYRRQVRVQKNIFLLAVYLVSFPQLIAGPIVRYRDIESQLISRNETPDGISAGLFRFITGLSKKVIIANTVSMVADGLFSCNDSEIGLLGSWLGAIAYSLQIYFDFSGYSDMAIGMGKMMGFQYSENFNFPYSAASITDFWHRWHISLSSFFRDYVYIPLGGNRVSSTRWITNMLIVWMLTGLWHGASFNFVLWGLYYGILLIVEKKMLTGFFKHHKILSRIYTSVMIITGWVIFRCCNMHKLKSTLLAMVGVYGMTGREGAGLSIILQRSGFGGLFILAFVSGIVFSMKPHSPDSVRNIILNAGAIPNEGTSDNKNALTIVRIISITLLIVCIIFLEAGAYNPFLYFQF